MLTINEFKQEYGNRIRRGDILDDQSTSDLCCVGGAFCQEMFDTTNVSGRFPAIVVLSAAIKKYKKVEHNLTRLLAARIIQANDAGDFELAWDILNKEVLS